jgi:hypothetical protein
VIIMPKQEGHATVARREPQKEQALDSVAAAAPHIGQLRVSACILAISGVEEVSIHVE